MYFSVQPQRHISLWRPKVTFFTDLDPSVDLYLFKFQRQLRYHLFQPLNIKRSASAILACSALNVCHI
ncbi:MAG: hypothetical protein ACTS5F_01475 [Candidatus Hodgkinia cicadicola]